MLPRFAAVCLVFDLILAGCGRDEPYLRKSQLPHEAFVWQRVWTPEVRVAVEGTEVEKLHVLAAEVGFDHKGIVESRIAVQWHALHRFRDRLGVVIRVHASAAATGWNSDACDTVADLMNSVLTQAKQAGLEPTECQIDYDCPVSKLGDYTKLLKHLQTRLSSAVVRITALPSWFSKAGAADLLRLSPSYILQVHSLHLPRTGRITGLIDYEEARSAIATAVEIGVPFRVALPTYSCVVEFAEDGGVKDVHGEDLPAGFSFASDRHAVLDSDAYELAELVSEWRLHASDKLQSIIWYRLPVSTDRLNWPLEVLTKIVRGERLERGWSVQLEPNSGGHFDVVLLQQGDAPDDLPREISITETEAADGLRGYVVAGETPGKIVLRLTSPSRFGRLHPGGKAIVGWVRSGGKSEAKILH